MDKKQTKPFDSKNATDSFPDPLLNQLDKIPSKTHGPLLIYENRANATEPVEIPPKFPPISTDENHYYTKSKPVKPKSSQKNDQNRIPHEPTFVGQIHPSFPQNKGKPPSSAETGENYIPGHSISAYPPPHVYQEDKESEIHANNGQIHGNESPEELLQLINQYPQIINYPAGSVLEIHNIPGQIPGGKPPQYTNHNTIGPEHPNLPYAVGDRLQKRPPIISQPPGITFEHILHEITKNSNLPQNSFGHNGLLPNNGQLFLQQPVHFNTQTQRNVTQGGSYSDLSCSRTSIIYFKK